MKRALIILTVALCLVFVDQAQAQRALKGMRGLELRGGMGVRGGVPESLLSL